MDVAADKPVAFQLPQRLGQHFLGHALDSLRDFPVPLAPVFQNMHDKHDPFAGYDLQHPPVSARIHRDIGRDFLPKGRGLMKTWATAICLKP